MQIKMIKGPRPGQTDMILNTSMGTFGVNMGETISLPDQAGYEAMAQWSSCLIEVKEAPVDEGKMVQGYKNKSASYTKE